MSSVTLHPIMSPKQIRSLANLLVCTSTELPFTQLPSYEARVDRFEEIIREALTNAGQPKRRTLSDELANGMNVPKT